MSECPTLQPSQYMRRIMDWPRQNITCPCWWVKWMMDWLQLCLASTGLSWHTCNKVLIFHKLKCLDPVPKVWHMNNHGRKGRFWHVIVSFEVHFSATCDAAWRRYIELSKSVILGQANRINVKNCQPSRNLSINKHKHRDRLQTNIPVLVYCTGCSHSSSSGL